MKNLEPKHILFLTRWFPNEKDLQLGVFVEKHALAVSSLCRVSVLHITHSPDREEKGYRIVTDEKENYFAVNLYYNRSTFFIKYIRRLINVLLYLRAFRIGNRLVKQRFGNYDLIHVHVMTRTAAVAWINKLFTKIPYLVTEHWTGYMYERFRNKSMPEKLFVRFLVSRASFLTTVSRGLKHAMLQSHVGNKNFAIVPNIIEQPIPQLATIDKKNKTIILTAADLVDSKKNISGTIKAMYYISKSFPNVELHIIGGGPDESLLQRLARDLGILNSVVFFLGRQANNFVLEYINNADFGIINSNVETFSVFAGELLAYGKPVIATRCGGPEEFVDNKSGILINMGNQHQLQNAIEYMLNNYQNYDKDYLKSIVQRRFNEESIAKKFFDIYKSILRNS